MVSKFLDQWTHQSQPYWNSQNSDVAVPETWALSPQILCSVSLNRDHAKLVRSADICSSDLKPLASTAPTDTPSLSELLALSSHRLVTIVQLSRFLPIYVKQAWIRQIRVIDLKRWQASLRVLEELYYDLRCAQEDYHPGRDRFEMTVSQYQEFKAEMTCIRNELNTIEIILKYVAASAKNSST